MQLKSIWKWNLKNAQHSRESDFRISISVLNIFFFSAIDVLFWTSKWNAFFMFISAFGEILIKLWCRSKRQNTIHCTQLNRYRNQIEIPADPIFFLILLWFCFDFDFAKTNHRNQGKKTHFILIGVFWNVQWTWILSTMLSLVYCCSERNRNIGSAHIQISNIEFIFSFFFCSIFCEFRWQCAIVHTKRNNWMVCKDMTWSW